MTSKYFDEYFKSWFVFGEHIDNKVDVADANGDVLIGTSKEHARIIIREREALLQTIWFLLQKLATEDELYSYENMIKAYEVYKKTKECCSANETAKPAES